MRKAKFNKQLTIGIPPSDYERVKRITDEQEISIAEWFRDAVAMALNNTNREGDKMNEQ
jgi:predicted HicB family RNase H-like nuclease